MAVLASTHDQIVPSILLGFFANGCLGAKLLGLKDGAELKPQALGSVAYEECATRPAYAGSAETAFPSGGYLEVDAEFEVAGNNEMSADASANMDC